MRKFLALLILFNVLCDTFSQQRYYHEISKKTQPSHIIDINEADKPVLNGMSYDIQSFILLQTPKKWQASSVKKLSITDDLIYITDQSNRSLFIYDLQGEAKVKIDITQYEKEARITDYEVYNDTLYVVDNISLYLFRFTKQGGFLSRDLLISNFADFTVKKECLYFISKHSVDTKNSTVRINVFDHSLQILKQYFVTIDEGKVDLAPRFYWGEEDEILFSITPNNIVYRINNNMAHKYLKVVNAEVIFSFAHACGLHSLRLLRVNFKPGDPLYTCYVKPDTNNGMSFETFKSEDLSLFLFNGIKSGIFQGNFVSYLDFNTSFKPIMPEMNWSNDRLKKQFYDIVEKIDENKCIVIVLYKMLDNSSLLD